MEFRKSILVNQPIEAVWEVLGNQYGEAYKWASGLYHSEGFGTPIIEGAHCKNRSCDTTQGKITEVIKTFNAADHHLEYEVVEGFPFFVDQGVNNWKLTPQGNKTRVDMHLVITTKGIMGAIMGPMMKMQMGKIVNNVLQDFKHYLETGKPSPLKAKEMAKRVA
ncbi:MAG: SRPBCC family protein [Bacteroidota bacterium]